MSTSVVEKAADTIRILSVAMVEKAKSGHPGGAMGGADYIHILFSEFLHFDPDDRTWPFRDRFFLDPGHLSPMLYSVLTLLGIYSIDEIKTFRQWGSSTPGHPELNVERGIENTSGPLGMGHAMAMGAAIAERFFASRFGEWCAHKTYTYISDGGIQEEISQGVGRLAGHLGLANYIMFYDSNDIQLSHATSAVSSEDIAAKYRAWGWRVETIDGHNHEEIRAALKRASEETEKPTLIVGKVIMGKGALDKNGNSFENQVSTHGMPLSKAGASVEKTIQNLGGDPADPFRIDDDVAEYYRSVLEEKRRSAQNQKEIQTAWEKQHPALAEVLKKIVQGAVPEIDFSAIPQKAGIPTRAASGEVLSVFAETIENMIVSSADLSNSDFTELFLKKTKAFVRGDFSGRFLQAGVSELTMAAVMNGLVLHGGIIPVCATFFVFSDYMKPAIRMASLMALPVKYVWTHDSFRVGEDGPTHHPIEQEAQIRLLERIRNFNGTRSMLVLRPADAAETSVAWKIALENTMSPTALILTRQNVADVPAADYATRFNNALEAQKGAYIVYKEQEGKPDIILLGNGSEVSLLFEVAVKLSKEEHLKIRVISAISEGLFREQPAEYQEQVLPVGVPIFGVTAGLPDALAGMVGMGGRVYGMERFGSSAPFQVLNEKYGYNVENIADHVKTYLREYKKMMSRMQEELAL